MSGGAGPALLRTATLNGGSLPVLALLNGPLALSRVPPPPPCRQKRAWQTSAVLEPLGCAAMAVFRVHQFCGGFNKASWPMWWREGNAWQTVAQCRGRQTMRRDCAAIAPALMTPPPPLPKTCTALWAEVYERIDHWGRSIDPKWLRNTRQVNA